jgi:DNA-binding SARP family transcriptional activator
MTALSIYLFGSVQVIRNQNRPINLRPTAKAMLACLLLHQYRSPQRAGQRREVLANHFWGGHEERHARRCLSTTLWRLRSELEADDVPKGTYLVTSQAGEVSFNFASDHWLDVVAFEEKVRQGMARPLREMTAVDVKALEVAQRLYKGELLEDCYGDWVFRERERLNLLHLNSLGRLMAYYERSGDYEKSLSCGQKILEIDPLREQVHRHMMKLYIKGGQRSLALQQYGVCREVLEKELGIQPMVETQALYSEIAASTPTRFATTLTAGNQPEALEQALHQLQVAMQNLNQAQIQLQQAQATVTGLSEAHARESATAADSRSV